jgi:asparagine synthetase B (glutamine-hydrolysing)
VPPAASGYAVRGGVLMIGSEPGQLFVEGFVQPEVTDHLAIEHLPVEIGDCWSLSSRWIADRMFDDMDHPPQGAAQVSLAAAAREAGVGVVLGGEGGDEWMTGANPYVCILDATLRRRPSQAWKVARLQAGSAGPAAAVRICGRAVFRQALPLGVQDLVDRARNRPIDSGLSPVVAPRSQWSSTERFARAWQARKDPVAFWRSYRELAPAHFYWRERHAFAPNAIEHRAPLNDLRVIELMAAAPAWMTRFDGEAKALLREVERPLVPAIIPERRDNGLYTELVERGVQAEERERPNAGAPTVPGSGR